MDPKRVVIIGCGGIGTWLAHALSKSLHAQAPESILVLVDGDTFEEKNVDRQLFEVYGNKAHSLRASIQPMASSIYVVPMAAWIVSEGNEADHDDDDDMISKITAEKLLEEGDSVFCVVDNHAARKLVFDAARNFNNIDVYTGGNDDKLYGSVYHYCRRDGEDITAHPAVYHNEFVNPPDRNPGELSCQERAMLDGGTQVLAINMAVASVLAAKAAQMLFGSEEQKAKAIQNAEVYFDLDLSAMEGSDRRIHQPEPALVES